MKVKLELSNEHNTLKRPYTGLPFEFGAQIGKSRGKGKMMILNDLLEKLSGSVLKGSPLFKTFSLHATLSVFFSCFFLPLRVSLKHPSRVSLLFGQRVDLTFLLHNISRSESKDSRSIYIWNSITVTSEARFFGIYASTFWGVPEYYYSAHYT